jgi:3',5'-cyclic AMP phosphodiesterase CpdA
MKWSPSDRLCLVTVFLCGIFGAANGQSPNIILGRPTDSAVTASIMFSNDALFLIEYGRMTGLYEKETQWMQAQAGRPEEVLINGLLPGQRYFYRVRFRYSTAFQVLMTPEYRFQTARNPGEPFVFTVESDEHLYDKKGVRSIYRICLDNQAKDEPDFMLSLGDTFGDDHTPTTTTSQDLALLHLDYRPYLGAICHSVPFFFCLGNHEGQNDYYLEQNPPNNIAVQGTLWRKYYYPNPFPNRFYSGNNRQEAYGIGQPENYYAWTWGDALFVVLDVYRYQNPTNPKPDGWDWTLGREQYDWLKTSLQQSRAKFKFVFAHHVRGQGRGGINNSKLFEWGGLNGDGRTYGFDTYRSGWGKPIHELFREYGVTIFFQGHDHLFAQEVRDNIVYQTVPMPSDSTYNIGMLANAGAFVSNTIEGTGHLRVKVSPDCVKVDFIRSWLPKDTLSGGRKNGEIAFSYMAGGCSVTSLNTPYIPEDAVPRVYPNPAGQVINIAWPFGARNRRISLTDALGRVHSTRSTDQLSLAGMPSGILSLKMEYNGKIHTEQVMVIK